MAVAFLIAGAMVIAYGGVWGIGLLFLSLATMAGTVSNA